MLRKARIEDVPHIRQLVNYYAQQQIMLPRALGELYETIRDFFVIEKNGNIIACGAMHVTWENYGEILSLAVSPEERKKGYGAMILDACIKEAAELGVKHLATLTYAQGFFEKYGFEVVDKTVLPHRLWSMCIKCPRFPDCDEIAMLKELD